MNKKGFTLLELLAIITILAIIALITTPIVLNLINQSKEAANERSVEAYAKAVEYAVARYQYSHKGKWPSDFNEIIDNVEYSNSDVKCNVAINCNGKGSVELTGCQVGNYTNSYYQYSSLNGNKGASVDNTNDHHTGNSSTAIACGSSGSGGSSGNNGSGDSGNSGSGDSGNSGSGDNGNSGNGGSSSSSNPYETDFSGTYQYKTIGSATWGNLDNSWNVYLRKNTSTNKEETCKVFSGGTICLEENLWDCDDQEDDKCVNAAGYVSNKILEFEAKGATCQLDVYDVKCFDNNEKFCGLDSSGSVFCVIDAVGECFVAGGGDCSESIETFY